ncbi:hypothetical protein O9929_20270 [Vibrio lentus]|nr:hypothetical protein [Vibrio lentus]
MFDGKQADTVTINKQFIDATGVKFNIDEMECDGTFLLLLGNTLSNGVQFVPSFAQSNSRDIRPSLNK